MRLRALFCYTKTMASLIYGTSEQAILQAIAATPGIPTQVILNRAAGYGDYAFPPQSTLNKRAGRNENALTYQKALATNVGYTGTGTVQDILLFANTNGKTLSTIVTGV